MIFLIFLLVLTINSFAQTDKPIEKERFNYLIDSLSTEKNKLLTEKETLLAQIDSLKNVLVELDSKWKSSRKSQLTRKYGNEIGARVLNGQIWKGMSEKMLEDSWGKPDKITTNKEKWGIFTQWYYGDITYFFKDGILQGWEETKK